jgi:hypothetical protein
VTFTKRLRDGIRLGRIRCSVRIWTRLHVKVGGRYRMEEGQIVVDSIVPLRRAEITSDLARESGFGSVKDLLQTAKHGAGDKIYLIRFHYLPPGAWDDRRPSAKDLSEPAESGAQTSRPSRSQLLHRIRESRPPRVRGKASPRGR